MKKLKLKKYRSVAIALAVLAVIFHIIFFVKGYDFPLLHPSGDVARRERDLLVFTTILSLFVIIPVFYMLFSFTSKYNESKKSKYQPELDNNVAVEVVWWAIPIILITILGVVTFKTSHSLDPFKPLASDQKPLRVDVVALPWKWLFIYPEEKIATVNYVKMPVGRPVNFHITSDAPMNSFWIPALGSQIYAMAGMESQVNLIADKAGDYPGMSANLSGEGFADMKFTASAVDVGSFNEWVNQIGSHENYDHFSQEDYDQLAKLSTKTPVGIYHLHDDNIFQNVINKYMGHNMATGKEN